MPDAKLPQWSIEKLRAQHDRGGFACGKPALDDFLRKYAGQNQKLGVSQTYVAIAPLTRVVEGYYTLSSGSVQFLNVPDNLRKGLPRYPVPVAHLGRLAVSLSAQGQGLGRLLLLDALERIVGAADSIGIHAIEVWAKDEQTKGFYAKYGFVPLVDDPLHLYLAINTVLALGLV